MKVAEMPLGPHSEARAELTERAESTLREQLERGRIGWRLSYSRNALRGAGCGRLGPIALCSDIGPTYVPSSDVGVSGIPKPPALCSMANIEGWSNFIDYQLLQSHYANRAPGTQDCKESCPQIWQ